MEQVTTQAPRRPRGGDGGNGDGGGYALLSYRRENSGIVMAVRSIFSINSTRPRLKGKK